MKLRHLIIPARRAACPQSKRSIAAFTMIEIALCLAIIGFALVAIIGVLPTGLNVQKDNRQETIINQDAAVWMDAMRNGAQGYNDLTNYVIAITNITQRYIIFNGFARISGGPVTNVYTYNRHLVMVAGSTTAGPGFFLNSGWHIIGALSRPRIEWLKPINGFNSNYIIANVRAMSGAAIEKFPQTNRDVLDSAFAYRLIPQTEAYVPFDTNLIQTTILGNTNAFDTTLTDIGARTNSFPSGMNAAQRQAFWDQVRNNRAILGATYTDSRDVRLTFRWPLLPNGEAGNGRQTFRFLVSGQSFQTNDPTVASVNMYFNRPGIYEKAR